ncbi:MAG: hypothetical protein KKC03_06625, partial [Bacteroidetes bacterium]|nr:hypothetical protein [Bacteroidota bacterium]
MTSKVLLPGFIITTLFFSPFFAIGQMKLDTEKYYCHYVSIDNGSSCFKFNKDKRFYFKEQGDLTVGGRFAQGFYTFYKDSLMLNYATEPVLVSNVERREWNEQSDSITIRFKVTNIDDICGVPCVFFLKEGKMFEPNRAYGAEYRFKKQKGTMVFKSASLGYSTVYFAFSG